MTSASPAPRFKIDPSLPVPMVCFKIDGVTVTIHNPALYAATPFEQLELLWDAAYRVLDGVTSTFPGRDMRPDAEVVHITTLRSLRTLRQAAEKSIAEHTATGSGRPYAEGDQKESAP